jgi:SPP1 family predicted phage head-tail adaptor
MRAGKLDRTITIQRQTETVSASGAVASAWTNLATVRAEMVQLSAGEFLASFGEADTTAIVFRVRYLAGIKNEDRVSYEGQFYDLKQVAEIGRRRVLELHCERTT